MSTAGGGGGGGSSDSASASSSVLAAQAYEWLCHRWTNKADMEKCWGIVRHMIRQHAADTPGGGLNGGSLGAAGSGAGGGLGGLPVAGVNGASAAASAAAAAHAASADPSLSVEESIRLTALAHANQLDTIEENESVEDSQREEGRRVHERRYRAGFGQASCYESLLERFLPLYPRGKGVAPPGEEELEKVGAMAEYRRLNKAKSRFLDRLVELTDPPLTEEQITAKVRQHIGGPSGVGPISLREAVQGAKYPITRLKAKIAARARVQSSSEAAIVVAPAAVATAVDVAALLPFLPTLNLPILPSTLPLPPVAPGLVGAPSAASLSAAAAAAAGMAPVPAASAVEVGSKRKEAAAADGADAAAPTQATKRAKKEAATEESKEHEGQAALAAGASLQQTPGAKLPAGASAAMQAPGGAPEAAEQQHQSAIKSL